MARKKQEIALQTEIETQEEWEEMLSKDGLTVVDIYQEWSGPCKAMISSFRRLKNELGDDLLRFSVAKSDTVDALEKYRGRCQPCYLFFAGGVMVSVVRGANAPLLTKTITEQLAYEHKVQDGQAERREIRDTVVAEQEDKDDDDEEDEEGLHHKGEHIIYESLPEFAEESAPRGFTVAIIKPNVVEEGKVDEVLERMRESGIEILEHQERHLTEEEAREFYRHKKDEEYFDDLVKFMTSGPSHVLVLTKGDTGEGIVEAWRELLGPASVEEAKEESPNSLRAQYGKDSFANALHGSDSQDTAMRELAFFFPDYVVPGQAKRAKVQRTLALIRPDALREKKDDVLAKIEEAGFKIAMHKEIQITKEMAEEFYKEHKGEIYFEQLTDRMCTGPLLALALAREDAVDGWRQLLGPKDLDEAKDSEPDCLRAQFAVEGVPLNQLHGSDTQENAEKELDMFFPKEQTMAVIKPDAYQTKDEIMTKIRQAGFHIAARKETELTKDIAEQLYKDHVGKEYYSDLTEHMASGPTLFMVLSREDAVEGWRSLIGPTDPEQAKDAAPDSIRAQFGHDIKANAVHGSSTAEQAKESMKLVFGDLEFNPNGTVKEPVTQRADSEQGEESRDQEDADAADDQQASDEEGQEEDKTRGEGEEEGEGKSGEDGEEGEKKTDGDQTSEGAEETNEDQEKTSQDGEQREGGDNDKDGDDNKDGDKASKAGSEHEEVENRDDSGSERGKGSEEQEEQEENREAEEKDDKKEDGSRRGSRTGSHKSEDTQSQKQEGEEGAKEGGEAKDDDAKSTGGTSNKPDEDTKSEGGHSKASKGSGEQQAEDAKSQGGNSQHEGQTTEGETGSQGGRQSPGKEQGDEDQNADRVSRKSNDADDKKDDDQQKTEEEQKPSD